jgi:hypothetical protein
MVFIARIRGLSDGIQRSRRGCRRLDHGAGRERVVGRRGNGHGGFEHRAERRQLRLCSADPAIEGCAAEDGVGDALDPRPRLRVRRSARAQAERGKGFRHAP